MIVGIFFANVNRFGKFDDYVDVNKYLDWNTKRAALDASPFVVALTSHIGISVFHTAASTNSSSLYFVTHYVPVTFSPCYFSDLITIFICILLKL